MLLMFSFGRPGPAGSVAELMHANLGLSSANPGLMCACMYSGKRHALLQPQSNPQHIATTCMPVLLELASAHRLIT